MILPPISDVARDISNVLGGCDCPPRARRDGHAERCPVTTLDMRPCSLDHPPEWEL